MQQTTLPDTDLKVSRFIFGTASFKIRTAGARARHYDLAVDSGFTHFDTAPYYGFGSAEADLRQTLRRNPHVTVTTKAGIYSPGGEQQPFGVVAARKMGGKLLPALSRPAIDFSVGRARNSLEASLRRLGRDRVEIFLLHEPSIEWIATEEWLRFLEDARGAGKVGRFGLAVDDRQLAPFLRANHPLLDFVQTTDSFAGREADQLVRAGRPLQVTYGYISAAQRAAGDGPVDVPAVLRAALERNRHGAIIVSTSNATRLAQYAAAADAAG